MKTEKLTQEEKLGLFLAEFYFSRVLRTEIEGMVPKVEAIVAKLMLEPPQWLTEATVGTIDAELLDQEIGEKLRLYALATGLFTDLLLKEASPY